jgi:hypothetical protein
MIVHHVEMNYVSAGCDDIFDFVAQAREIRR